MILQNESRRHSSALASVCRFLYSHFKCADKVLVHVVDREPDEEDQRIGGLADKHNGTAGKKSRVTIWMGPDGLKYPYTTEHEGLRTRVQSWEEEFVLVLAHELRHIDQFWLVGEPDEHDAESYAIKVLKEYRKA